MTLMIDSHVGLGDQVYMRPFVRALADHEDLYLSTAWPELYWDDARIKPVMCHRDLRTQRKHAESLPESTWHTQPKRAGGIDLTYSGRIKDRSIWRALRDQAGVVPYGFRLPVDPKWDLAADALLSTLPINGRAIGVYRPGTLRREWYCPARNPAADHLPYLAERVREKVFWIAVAYLDGREESLADDSKQPWDHACIRGELPWTTLAAIVARARVTLSAVGFMLPLSIALNARAFFVYGGHLPSEVLVDPAMEPENYGHVQPDPFCYCLKNKHGCDKQIDPRRLETEFDAWWNRTSW